MSRQQMSKIRPIRSYGQLKDTINCAKETKIYSSMQLYLLLAEYNLNNTMFNGKVIALRFRIKTAAA